MKTEDKALELLSQIKATVKCSEDEASMLAVMFVEMTIQVIEKTEYYNTGPQIDYWKGVLDHIYI